MSIAALVLGILNIAIVIAALLFLAYAVVWLIKMFGFEQPSADMKKAFLLLVLLIFLYMLAALLFGMPTLHILRTG